jgi:hypothetical protein
VELINKINIFELNYLLAVLLISRSSPSKVYRIVLRSEINHRNKRFKGAKKGVFDFSTGIAEILLNPYNMNMQSPRSL